MRWMDRIRFLIERQFVKGALFQLLIVMLVIGLISLAGGTLVAGVDGQFDSFGAAVWWAFLRLTDPGYLGDDQGSWMRFVSTLLTVSGYVVFLGALVAIMTRKLIAVMQALELGLTPVYLRNHIVVLGWNSRTRPLLRELLHSTGRMQRFLEKHDTRRLQLVVLSEQASVDQRLELRVDPGIGRRARQIILRSGTPLQPEALNRVACLDAAVVIIPGDPHGEEGLVTSDMETVKALLSIAHQGRETGQVLPFVVAELQDMRKRSVLERAYPGELEVVAGDLISSRLLVQNILHRGLSLVYNELLTDSDGNEVYIRSGDAMGERSLAQLSVCLPSAIVLGLLRADDNGVLTPVMVLDRDAVIGAADRVVIMARHYDETRPVAGTAEELPGPPVAPAGNHTEAAPQRQRHRVLVLGWNRRAPTLLAELASYATHHFTVDLASTTPAASRKAELRRRLGEEPRLDYHVLESDFAAEGELRRLAPQEYDTVLLLSSDRLASGEEADARSMVGHLLLDELLAGADRRPQLLLELSDPANRSLLTLPDSEVMVTPIILSHILAQVALRRELGLVFEELFTVGGAEFLFQDIALYDLSPEADFRALEEAAAARGEIALGLHRPMAREISGRLLLNPERQTPLSLTGSEQAVVLGLV